MEGRDLNCHCGNQESFEQCCEPLLIGDRSANTAEQLMRSRYSAFVVKNMPYILKTHDPATRSDVDMDGNSKWANQAQWDSLEIKRVEGGGPQDTEGWVEFVAKYAIDGKPEQHHELSQFMREKGQWFFVGGKVLGLETYQREQPKVGRNDPCSCGSGKKFKKCCG